MAEKEDDDLERNKFVVRLAWEELKKQYRNEGRRDALAHPDGETHEPPRPPGKHPGGRRAKYDWDQFWSEIVRLADQHRLPPREDLHEHMVDWLSTKWPDQPDESEIRKRLSTLYDHMKRPRP
jgi:hypothetical protein